MARHTEHYGLNKPEPNDFYDVGIGNDNLDVIDELIKGNEDAIATKASKAVPAAANNLAGLALSGDPVDTGIHKDLVGRVYTSLASMGLSDEDMSPTDFGANVLAMINATAQYSTARFAVGSAYPNLLASIKAYLNDTNNDYFFELLRSTSASLPNKIFIVRNQANSLQPLWYSTYDDGLPPPVNLSTGFVSKAAMVPQEVSAPLIISYPPIPYLELKASESFKSTFIKNANGGAGVDLGTYITDKNGANETSLIVFAKESRVGCVFNGLSYDMWHGGNFPKDAMTNWPLTVVGSNQGAATILHQYTYYKRQGDFVYISLNVGFTRGTMDGNVQIQNLPYVAKQGRNTVNFGYFDRIGTITNLQGNIGGYENYMALRYNGNTAVTSTMISLTEQAMIQGSAIYEIAL